MKALVGAAALVVGHLLINCSPASSQDHLPVLLSPDETHAYYACLKAAWVEDYCRANSARWSATYDRVLQACIVANGGGNFPLNGRHWWDRDDYCWAAARSFRR